MGKKNGNQPTDSASLEWSAFLTLVPKSERRKMAEDLVGCTLLTYQDYVNYCQRVQYYLLLGWLSPQMSAELRAWAEEAYTALTATAIHDEGRDRHIIEAIESAQQARMIESKPPEMDPTLLTQLREYESVTSEGSE